MEFIIFLPWIADFVSNLKEATMFISLVVGGALSVGFIISAAENKIPTVKKRWYILLVICISISVIVPSKTSVYQMAALYGGVEIVDNITKNETAKRLAPKSLKVLEKLADDFLGDEK